MVVLSEVPVVPDVPDGGFHSLCHREQTRLVPAQCGVFGQCNSGNWRGRLFDTDVRLIGGRKAGVSHANSVATRESLFEWIAPSQVLDSHVGGLRRGPSGR